MQHHAADQLHIEMAHFQGAFAGFSDNGKGFGQQRIEGFTARQSALELFRLGAQLGITQRRGSRLLRIDPFNNLAHRAEYAVVAATKNVFENVHLTEALRCIAEIK